MLSVPRLSTSIVGQSGLPSYFSGCLFHCPSFCLFVRPYVRLSACLSVHLFVCLSVCLSVCLFVCLSGRLSGRLFFHLSVCLSSSVHLSVCLSVRFILSVHLVLCLAVRPSVPLTVCFPAFVRLSSWMFVLQSICLSIAPVNGSAESH